MGRRASTGPEGRTTSSAGDESSQTLYLDFFYSGVVFLDVTSIGSLISSVGFPIASCAVLFYLLYKSQEDHKTESEKWIKALDDNTAVMQALLKKLGADEIDS